AEEENIEDILADLAEDESSGDSGEEFEVFIWVNDLDKREGIKDIIQRLLKINEEDRALTVAFSGRIKIELGLQSNRILGEERKKRKNDIEDEDTMSEEIDVLVFTLFCNVLVSLCYEGTYTFLDAITIVKIVYNLDER
ncbi:hypothetical protein ACJX0J_013452, partial [Zea mays]